MSSKSVLNYYLMFSQGRLLPPFNMQKSCPLYKAVVVGSIFTKNVFFLNFDSLIILYLIWSEKLLYDNALLVLLNISQ